MAFDSAPSAVHLDQLLTNLTLDYVKEQSFIADRVFPVVDVEKKSDEFYTFDPAEGNSEGSDEVTLLAPRTTPRKFDVSHGKDSYMAKVYGLAFDIDMQTAANEDEHLRVRERKARLLMNKLLKKRDRDFIATFMQTGVWGEDLVGTTDFTKWSDGASTPIDDIMKWKEDFQIRNYGFEVNKIVLTKDIKRHLLTNTQILGRINGGATIANPAMINDALIASIFEVDEIVIADAVSNTAAVGATEVADYMVKDKILMTHTPMSAGLETPASGLIFAWNSIPNVSWGISMETFTDDALRRYQIAEEVHGKMAYDMKVVAPKMGTFVSDVV